MSLIDWIVLVGFLVFIVVYGVWKTQNKKDIKDYLLANKRSPWYVVTLSIMATQASAITFLSTPGQAYTDGMRFLQFYLGLPIAMIILSITAVPIFHKLNVYTAYEYLEQRFDLKNRALGSILFLMQRGLAAGFTIFAPALIISVLLGWNIELTILLQGILVIIYTASGGTEAVNKTHILQMIIITVGMACAFFMIIHSLPNDISFLDAAKIAGKMGKLNAITFDFNWKDPYTIWSGLIGGTFLALSYFGTDQSQVQRYLTGKSVAQSRIGLLANGIVKVPMQFGILFLGAMVFVFYQFAMPPLFFNPVQSAKVKSSAYSLQYKKLKNKFTEVHSQKESELRKMLDMESSGDKSAYNNAETAVKKSTEEENQIRDEATVLIKKANPGSDGNDTNYIFLTFVINVLPAGLIGLVLAAILSASMSSTSAELNALASTTVIDIYKRTIKKDATEKHYVFVSKLATVFWGFYAIGFAFFANRLGTLIVAVNVLGSLFYGTILGIFMLAFYFKKITGSSVFYSAIITELMVIALYLFTPIPFLWFNVIGCVVLILLAHFVNPFFNKKRSGKLIDN
jgi:SSS family transporter